MKILLLGEIYSNNLGDGVICETVKKIIEEYMPKAEIKMVDLSCRKEFTTKQISKTNKNSEENLLRKLLHKSLYLTYKVQILKKNKMIKEACKEQYDLAVFAGGNLFMDYFVMYIVTFIKYLSRKNIPIIFNACGAGNIKDKFLLRKLKKALKYKNIVSISSRDNVNKINEVYLEKEFAQKTYDPALSNKKAYNIISCGTENIIGLGIMKVPFMEEMEITDFWIKIINQLDNAGLKWQIFCNGEESDHELAKKIIEKTKKDPNKYWANRPSRPKELVETICKYQKIISFRLHSHIIAYSLQIPSIAFEWDSKVKSFFEDIGHADNCIKIDSNIDIVEILKKASYNNNDKENLEKKQILLEENLKSNINIVTKGV